MGRGRPAQSTQTFTLKPPVLYKPDAGYGMVQSGDRRNVASDIPGTLGLDASKATGERK